jgi:GABA permease
MTRVLVITMSGIGVDEVRTTIARTYEPDAEIHVVAPASEISRLDWLANAEDDARNNASVRAEEVADALPADDVGAEVGDSDPVQAIEDAIRLYDPDEIVVVSSGRDGANWLEDGAVDEARDRFDLPISHVVVE